MTDRPSVLAIVLLTGVVVLVAACVADMIL